MFHDGSEFDCTQVIRHGKRILQEDKLHIDALSMMALANVYLGREKDAWKYLSRTESNAEQTVILNLALGVYFKAHNQLTNTTEHWLKALEFAPKLGRFIDCLEKCFYCSITMMRWKKSSNSSGATQSLSFDSGDAVP